MEYYRQCELVLKETKQVAWIPESFAKVGRVLKIRKNSKWTNGWVVKSVGGREDEEFVRTAERSHLKHRDITDI